MNMILRVNSFIDNLSPYFDTENSKEDMCKKAVDYIYALDVSAPYVLATMKDAIAELVVEIVLLKREIQKLKEERK